MTLLHGTLFLGFLVSENYASALEKNNSDYNALFIQTDDAYLREIYYQGVRYLGKFVNNEQPLTQLELLEANIYSLLKKLVSDYNYKETSLILFALPQQHATIVSS